MSLHPFDKLPLGTSGALLFTPCLMAAIILCERGMRHDQILDQVKALRPNALKLSVHTDYLQQACKALEGRRSADH